jgi:hypothetical protein
MVDLMFRREAICNSGKFTVRAYTVQYFHKILQNTARLYAPSLKLEILLSWTLISKYLYYLEERYPLIALFNFRIKAIGFLVKKSLF